MFAVGPDTITYQETEKLIQDVVWQFRRRFGADDVDEMMAVARLEFVEAFNRYKADNPKGANFTTHLRFRVWHALLTWKRKAAKRASRMHLVPVDAVAEPTAPTDSDSRVRQLLDSVSADARAVINLVFETPSDISVPLAVHMKRVSPKTMYRAILRYLRDAGWEQPRIRRAFDEVRGALVSA